jgi:hypothetical protein
MSAVWELDLPREQKLVLMAFADHANDDGFTYPSLARVAWKCGYEQPRSVSGIVQKLLESQVLVMIEAAHGRTPTLYQIRPHNARALPPFDASAFKQDKGAANAPHDGQSGSKPLNPNGEQLRANAQGAETAPQASSGCEKRTPSESVGVRSGAVGVRSNDRRGAVATAPESLTYNQDARARAGPAQGPARAAEPQLGGEEFLLDNEAKQLGISKRQRNESLRDYRGRIQAAHDRKLHAAADEIRARKRAEADAKASSGDEEAA